MDPARLNSNENPYGPSKRVRAVLKQSFDIACRYPFTILGELVEMIAQKEGVTKDHVVVTGGSTEGLKVAGLLYGKSDEEIIAADPTFQSLLQLCGKFWSQGTSGSWLTSIWNMILKQWRKKSIVKLALCFFATPTTLQAP